MAHGLLARQPVQQSHLDVLQGLATALLVLMHPAALVVVVGVRRGPLVAADTVCLRPQVGRLVAE